MKKTKLIVALVAATAMATMFSTKVFAALPTNALIIGNKAYDVGYISKNVKQLNDILNNSTQYTDIYYNDVSGNVLSLFSGDKITDLTKLGVNSLTYYDYNGNKNIYKLTNGQFNPDTESSTIQAEITVTPVGSGIMNFISIKIPDASKVNVKPYTLEPQYFKVYNSNNSDLIKKIGVPSSISGESNDDYVLNLISTDPYLRLQILSSDKVPIATTKPQTLQVGKNTVNFTLDSYFIPPESYNPSANGLGNINNNGLTTQSGDWTYYSNSSDGGGIYKTNGVQSYKISEDNAKFINVVGDWIYYSNYSDGQKIYKIKVDGTGRRIVSTDQASYLVVLGEYIYYSYHSGTGVGNIRKISRNASKSPGENVTSDEAEYIIVSGDMIYYTNKNQGNSIYAIHTDGTYRSKISSDNAKFITLANEKIYYVTSLGQLKWISKNGGSFGTILVSNGNTGSNAVISSMNITDDGKWIYYADSTDGNKMYRAPLVDYLRISGDKYSNDYTNFINIVGGKIYYTKLSSMFIANEPTISSKKDSYGRAIYDYSSTAITKIKQDLKILSYDKVATPTKNAVGADVNNLEEYLPDKVTAVMSDNSIQELLVNWNLNPTKSTKGSAVQYEGTIVGYGTKVTLTLSMASEAIPATSVKVINNAGLLDDKIYINLDDQGIKLPVVANLQVGDTIKVYRDPLKSELLGQDIVVPSIGGNVLNSTIVLRREKTVTDDAKYVYITRTSAGVLESEPVQVQITGGVSGKPTFNKDNLSIKVINYGTLPNGLTENDIVEIAPTTELQQGDIVNVYKKVDNVKVRIGSQMVEYVPDPNPFAEKKFKATIILPAGYIEYKNGGDNNIYITRSTQFAESDDLTVAFDQGVALPLGMLSISGTAGNVLVRTTLDTQYEYYYKVFGPAPLLGEDITDPSNGWTKIADPTNPKLDNIINGDDVYIVQTYSGKALKSSHAIAQVK
ncbi:DUF5050 domain-containing protein [Clostridium magnum]|uniref:DUF5050 domain-containing protein n=1 Tax=Clostridium magnum DSM 2767 TaxID=1121326 RepID=A0A162UNY9_9CLOT|nr:DUF5050 domain-containing protein [Clostridium magnum]KZL94130.1 hypothetical protein CLMAG_11830 [Clostridium magnum DSM 2767]SHH94496.1 Ig-like domain (group 4) [Clostridium magnum DSM 2767]